MIFFFIRGKTNYIYFGQLRKITLSSDQQTRYER